jgi:hypothetical protein
MNSVSASTSEKGEGGSRDIAQFVATADTGHWTLVVKKRATIVEVIQEAEDNFSSGLQPLLTESVVVPAKCGQGLFEYFVVWVSGDAASDRRVGRDRGAFSAFYQGIVDCVTSGATDIHA